jgi:hypothetical protein
MRFHGGSIRSEADYKVTIAMTRGSMDRVTADVEATSMVTDTKGNIVMSAKYALKCRPAQRMF